VHVVDGLPGVRPGVEHHPVAVAVDALGYRDGVRVGDNVTQQPVAGGCQIGQIGVMSARDNKHVYWRLRIDIAEGNRPVITGHYGRRYLAGGYCAEQAVGHAGDLNVFRVFPAADIYGCFTANPRCTTPLVQGHGQ